jgi:hypothetical protein
MVPERGKSPVGFVKRCKVLVFEMCSSIKTSFVMGKNTKGLARNGQALVDGFCVGVFSRLITGQGGGGMVCC